MNRRSVVAITFSFVAISPFSFVVVVVVKSLLKERESSKPDLETLNIIQVQTRPSRLG